MLSPHLIHPVSTNAQTSPEFITQGLALRPSAVAFSFCQRFFLLCGFYVYVQMILILSHRKKKFNLFFIKVQSLPCQSNPFISPSMNRSCQPVIPTLYPHNGPPIIPTSEKLPFVNYIATDEAQTHWLWCPLSITHRSQAARPALAPEQHFNQSLGFRARTQRGSLLLRAHGNQVYITALQFNKLSPQVWESD